MAWPSFIALLSVGSIMSIGATQDCHCLIIGDPVAFTCSGDSVFFAESDGPVIALIYEEDAGCNFTLAARAVGHYWRLLLVMGARLWEISPEGHIDPSSPSIPGSSSYSVSDPDFSLCKIISLSCGVEIRVGHGSNNGHDVIKADIKVPGDQVKYITGGFCVTNTVMPSSPTSHVMNP